MSLPEPKAHQAYCNVSALEAGEIELTDELFITGATPGAVTVAPSLSFLLQHSSTDHKLVFDLGIRRDWENYPPAVVEWIKKYYPVQIPQNVEESLQIGGLSAADIDYVCLSHVHFDHIGDTSPFKKSTFLVGASARQFFDPGYPIDPNGRFAANLLPAGRTEFLDTTDWEPLGPFPRAKDFYNDGSLYIIDAPGHLAGHINILARTSADGAWIYLAGDTAHHWNLVTGESEIACGHPAHFHICAHEDKEAAEEHISRIQVLWKVPRIKVMLAHDEPWFRKNKGGSAFWPGKIPSL